MYLDFKETVWSRVKVTEKLRAKVATIINSGGTMNDVFEYMDQQNVDINTDVLFETTTPLNPEDNGGAATIELFEDSNDHVIAGNSIVHTLSEKADRILTAVEKCDGYCPCVKDSIGKEEYKCPCEKFQKEYECCCSLYVKKV